MKTVSGLLVLAMFGVVAAMPVANAQDSKDARALLDAVGRGIAAPSANRFGHVSPTTAAHVAADLRDAPAIILDGGPCDVGIESTIVAFRDDEPVLLRPGAISVAEPESTIV